MTKISTLLDRIESDPDICGGTPVIKGTRIPVLTVVKMIAGEATVEDVIAQYPELSIDDIAQAVLYAALKTQGDLWSYIFAEEKE